MVAQKDKVLANTALLVVDMQSTILSMVPYYQKIIHRTAFAVEVANLFELPIVFTEQRPEKLQPTCSKLSNLANDFNRFSKSTFSALQVPDVANFVNKNGIRQFIIAGIETPICIYQTVLDCLAQNITATLLSDCLGARRIEDAAVAKNALIRKGAHYLPSETVFYSALSDSLHPLFKAYNELVKKYQPALSR